MNIVPSRNSPWRIAHRGLHHRCVENTLEAFAAAYGLGCDLVEFDVQLSADGIPVVFHDDDLLRLGGRPEALFSLNARELQAVPLRDPETLAMGRMPTLAQFMQQFGTQPYYLEIKVPEAKQRVSGYWKSLTEKVMAALLVKSRNPLTFAASFHPEVVRYALRELNFPRVALIHEKLETLRAALSTPDSDPLRRRCFDSVSFAVYREALDTGLTLLPERLLLWNVAGPEQFGFARQAGVAGIVADAP